MSFNYEIRFDQSQDAAYQQLMSALERQEEAMQRARVERMKNAELEIKQKMELTQSISPAVATKNYEIEFYEKVDQLHNNVKELQKSKPDIPYPQLWDIVQTNTAALARHNAKFKLVKNKVEEDARTISDPRINKTNLINAALTDALYKQVHVKDAMGNPVLDANGVPVTKRVIKSEEELDDQADFISKQMSTGGDKFLNYDAVAEDITERIKKAPPVTIDVMVSKGASRGKAGYTSREKVQVPSFGTWDPNSQKVVVKTKDGMLDPDVYTYFAGKKGETNDIFIESRAMEDLKNADPALLKRAGYTDIYKADGTVDPIKLEAARIDASLPDNKQKVKSAWLSNYIEKTTGYTTADAESTKPAITVNTGSEQSKVGSNWMKEMESAWEGGDVEKINQKLNTLYAGGTNIESITYDGNKIVAKFRSGDPLNPLPKKIVINKSDANALTKIAGLYQSARGADKGVEQFIDKKIKVF